MVGYHHVLMILIAVAIILLCTSPLTFPALFPTFLNEIGMCTNHLQHSCWLDALHHPRKYPISSSSPCTMRSTSPFSISRKSTPAW